MARLDPEHPIRKDRITQVMLGVLAASIVLAASLIYVAAHPPEPRVVLDNPVPQEVVNTLPNIAGAALTLDQDVHVIAEKCNLTDETLLVEGDVFWQTVSPRGTQIQTGSGESERLPGCTEQDFENGIPELVAKRTRELVAEGRPFVVWQILGRERARDCSNCAPAGWSTEPFRLFVEAP